MPDLSITHLFLSDPVLLTGFLLPLVIIGAVLFFRIRAYRRITALAARNEQRFDRSSATTTAQWQEASERSERMIALLTEIRDQLARIAPPAPQS